MALFENPFSEILIFDEVISSGKSANAISEYLQKSFSIPSEKIFVAGIELSAKKIFSSKKPLHFSSFHGIESVLNIIYGDLSYLFHKQEFFQRRWKAFLKKGQTTNYKKAYTEIREMSKNAVS